MGKVVIDAQGYRQGVGIIIISEQSEVLWARRIGQNAWQFPQGGLQEGENPEQALYRELYEELGLVPDQVSLVGSTRGWLAYRLPEQYQRHHLQPLCIGQKQKWYMLKLLTEVSQVRFDSTQTPEFDRCRWVHYWYPLKQVIPFKRHVYRRALEELAPLLPNAERRYAQRRNRFLRIVKKEVELESA